MTDRAVTDRAVTDRAVNPGLLRVRGLGVTISTPAGPIRPVDDVSFDLAADETLGVVGESGSGKSVLARTVMGLVGPGRRVERTGTVELAGTRLDQLSGKQLRALWGGELGMVLQDPLTSLNPVRRIGSQIVETVRRHDRSYSRAAATERAEELLRSVGIPEPKRRLRAFPHQLSGGMRQRVMIALALSGDARLLIADEPTTALDVSVQHQILNLLAERRAAGGRGMILVTHDLGVVAGRTDRVIVMYGGEVVESAPTRTLFRNVRMPYTRALLDALPTPDTPTHSRLRSIPGRPVNLADVGPGCRFAARCAAAGERCHIEHPPLVSDVDDPEHRYRCWRPVGSPEYAAAIGSTPTTEGART